MACFIAFCSTSFPMPHYWNPTFITSLLHPPTLGLLNNARCFPLTASVCASFRNRACYDSSHLMIMRRKSHQIIFKAENDVVGQELQRQLEAAEKELKQVHDLFGQAADNCLNLKKPY
ncbi:hypothetical protein TEA_028429 [Camellia sinensis var. sinensis]|uniref:Uncharacterized protein n=1 Tax=Camellia sinensis var. sinensis TaxID=542762 RepID=A0A4S4EHR8_CAMSN|nr:hypothetical protein TEA_028429 [Camellia sinensis var. sinensis]